MRLREEGHVFTGEVHVVPAREEDLVQRLDELSERILNIDWKLYDVVIVPVGEVPIPSRAEAGDGLLGGVRAGG